MTPSELENRLIDFAIGVVNVFNGAPRTAEIIYIKDQAFRSAASAALNYGEAQAAESRKDFAHKCSIVLKELRECYVGIKLLKKLNSTGIENIASAIEENNELISIFVKTVEKVKRNNQ